MEITVEPFGTTKAGVEVSAYVLRSPTGLRAKLTNYGATLTELWLPDRDGDLTDVVLGFDSVVGYESEANQYFGCTVGRVCNRIARGKFTLDGKQHALAVNNGPNHLHGGVRGFDKAVWEMEGMGTLPDRAWLKLVHSSPNGDEGYPGRIDAAVTYALLRDGGLQIEYEATCNAPTPINLTNHTYWNLHGAGSATVLDHELMLPATHYTPTDDTLIPTGEIAPVGGTPLDFTRPWRIGARIAELDDTGAIGYDHNFVLREAPGPLVLAARLRDPGSGRILEIHTTEPGIQFYSGNFLTGAKGKGGKVYAHRSALCLETQHFPDSVNHPGFPSTILRPGHVYRSTTVHRFSLQ